MLSRNQITGKGGRIPSQLQDLFGQTIRGTAASVLENMARSGENIDLVRKFGNSKRRACRHALFAARHLFEVGVGLVLGDGGHVEFTLQLLLKQAVLPPVALGLDNSLGGGIGGLQQRMLDSLRVGLEEGRRFPVGRVLGALPLGAGSRADGN